MGGGKARGKEERLAVPAMPMPLAVICCVLNFLIPGLGTSIAGFSAFCCSRNEDMTASARCGSCCISLLFGFLQLLLTAACLIGWVWSCAWGIFMIGMSVEYYHNNPADGERARPGAVVSPSVVVVNQPMPSGSYGYPAPMAYGPAPPYPGQSPYPSQQQYPDPPHHYPPPQQYPEPPPYTYPTTSEPSQPTLPPSMEPLPTSPPPPYKP